MAPPVMQRQALSLDVNGRRHAIEAGVTATLLEVLRNDLQLSAPKYGCGLGQCGACTVHIDGVAARACVIPADKVQDRAITTLEGLGDRQRPHVVQQAFIDAQAAQCGYCLNGMVMTAAALLAHQRRPSAQEIRDALSGNLCRCGTHVEILQAVARAAQALADAAGPPADTP